ncbi:hypothetical protein IB286_14280 [Spongiibacter sp. KMU-158]|uniref:Lipoprotein n=1 Tax=Spongiibacter pelagi TaxID=2760804 RepID=A0A927GX55_9GAMM|nr:hypothetical protein [Spongiibacter pelagi]MBD2860165.1 hypothetical protein [Spongiibacter pelagi]
MDRTIKYLAVLSIFISMIGCTTKPYVPPQSGLTASIFFDQVNLPTIPFVPKAVSIKLYDGCFEGNPNTHSSFLGWISIKEEELSTNPLIVPAAERLLISYGAHSGSCDLNFGFIPEQGAEYSASFNSSFGGCTGKITRKNGEPVPGITFHKPTSFEAAVGAADAWRHCDNINR